MTGGAFGFVASHQTPIPKRPVHLPAQAGVVGIVKSVRRGDGSIVKEVGKHAADDVRFKASLSVEMSRWDRRLGNSLLPRAQSRMPPLVSSFALFLCV
jgi:hypothetical protein